MERRDNNRVGTRAALEARAQGRTFSTQLYDLSPTGCRFDCDALVFSRGEKIVFKFNDKVRIAGKIAWRRGGTAGVQFKGELPDAVRRYLDYDRLKADG